MAYPSQATSVTLRINKTHFIQEVKTIIIKRRISLLVDPLV